MSNKRGAVFILIFILLASICFSFVNSQDEDHYSVTKIYGPGDTLEGWIKRGFTREPVTSIFHDNKWNSINIIDLLKSDPALVEGVNYNCSIPGCGMTYVTSYGEYTKTLSLDSGESKIIGFKISDEGVNHVNNISFDISSNAGADCKNQIEIDFFIDGDIDLGNNKNSIWDCTHLRDTGCFDLDKYEDIDRGIPGGDSGMFCQKIELSESPGFKLGAWLKIGGGAQTTKMAIYNLGLTEKLAECEITDNSETPSEGEERSCDVDFLVLEPTEYYVCIFNDVETDLNTKIRSYSDPTEGCGFPYPDYLTEVYAYDVFAQGKMFAEVGVVSIDDELGYEASQYISEKYGSTCPTGGCIVPLKITSNIEDQNISIGNISFEYDSGGVVEITKLWDLDLSAATVTTAGDYQTISLNNANFTLPTQYGSFTYEFRIEGDLFFEETLYIERGPTVKSFYPLSVFNGIASEFKVSVDLVDNAGITEYEWQFGDATPKKTTTNRISHTFSVLEEETPKTFPVRVTATDENGKTGSKSFEVRVDSYLLYFSERADKVKENLANIETQIENFSLFYQEGIKKVIDTPTIRQELLTLEERKEQAVTVEDHEAVVRDFLELESGVPESILEKISTDFVSFYPSLESIELGIVGEVLGGSYDTTKAGAYKDAVLTWNVGNLNNKVKYNQITAEHEDGRSIPILSVFELDLKKVSGESGTIFIKELENMKFDRDYGEQAKSGYVYIPLDSGKKIKFYTTQDIGITNLPVFVSPALDVLTIIEEYDEAEAQRMKWLLFFLIMFFLLIVAIIVYIILQQWYKHKYETYLFKNRNFLFNLIHYIDAQKKKGVKDGEIFRKLKKAGWTSEQINYVIRKYLGKRTGMLEIPVEKILRIFRKKGIPQAGVPSAPGPIGPLGRFRPR